MREVRRRFHEELHALESEVQQTGRQAQLLLERALQALARGDPAVCDEVIRGDDEVDQLYLDVERRILGLFALQTPVASDLRLLTALLHINLHLERIADQAVNMAKITKLAHGLPPNPTVLQHLEEMGALALRMVGAAMAALARRDLDLTRTLPEMDDPLDRLNRGMLQQVLAASDDQRMLEWGIRMYVVSRQIERIGDNTVDIAEQVAFLVTREFREFTDASHPEIEHPSCWRAGGRRSRQPCRPASHRSTIREGGREPLGRLPGRHAGQHQERRRPRSLAVRPEAEGPGNPGPS
jgi:phosphate transport system protein